MCQDPHHKRPEPYRAYGCKSLPRNVWTPNVVKLSNGANDVDHKSGFKL